jgi:cell division protein ZapA
MEWGFPLPVVRGSEAQTSRRRQVANVAKDAGGIRVVIYDQEYCMRGDLDEEYIQKLAQYLDTKMRAVAARTRTVDSLRVAVLAGLNIADEYHQEKAKHEETTKRLDEKVDEWSRMLDRFLKEAV